MQGYPTSVYPTIVNNPPCSFLGECDITSSISTSYFELKKTSEEELISFFWPYSNLRRKFFFPNTICTHPTTSFLILLLLPSLVIFSNSPTLAFTTDPTPIFFLVCFFISISYLIVTTGELMVDLDKGDQIDIKVANSERMVDFFCVKKSFQQKYINRQKIARALRTNNYSLRKSYHASPYNPPSLAGQLQSHLSKIEKSLTCVYI